MHTSHTSPSLHRLLPILCLLLTAIRPATAQDLDGLPATKRAAVATIEGHRDEMVRMSDAIWEYAETALEETRSARVLADYARAQGLQVREGVAGLPTAFIASYGSGRPYIGILGEFDALPGLSQQTVPEKRPLQPGAAGHGCGHNMFGVASLEAAVAIKQLIEQGRLQGTVRFYGTPAEETIGGKLYMARAGLFDDLDVCLDWHPADKIEANAQSSQALIDFRVRFKGKSAHAAFDPWNGKSAVDGLELFTTGLNMYREHIRPTARIHYLIEDAGDVVNVVPDHAAIWTRVREADRDGAYQLYERAKKIAEGAALMADVEYSIELISGMHEVVMNRAGAAALQANLEALGPLSYTDEELAFAKAIQLATGKEPVGIDGSVKPLRETLEAPEGGSTDVGDVSWLVPEIRLSMTTAPKGTPWHSWAVVACGGMSIGHKGMIHASKALALTMVDLFEDPDLRKAVRGEFQQRRGDQPYEPILPPGDPPLPGKPSAGQLGGK